MEYKGLRGIYMKKPWYKRWTAWAVIIVALGIFGNLLPDVSDDPPAEVQPAAELLTQTKSAEELAAEKANEERAAERAAKIQEVSTEPSEAQAEKPAEKKAPAKPLTKEEVLAKFPLDSENGPYIDGPFIFVGDRKDTADFYLLEDTDRYRNASVIFKNGEIARVKFIPEGDTEPEELLAEFGITEEPRELGGMVISYEVALIPMFWSQNIKLYPFELD